MITDKEAADAAERLKDMGPEVGKAKADVERYQHRRKASFAFAKAAAEGTIADKEAAAYKNARFIEALEKELEAIASFEALKAEVNGHNTTIQVWQTMSANNRSGERGYR